MPLQEHERYDIQSILPLSVSLGSIASTLAESTSEIRGKCLKEGEEGPHQLSLKSSKDSPATESSSSDKKNPGTICLEKLRDKEFVRKLIISISIGWAFCMLGWCKGQIGPSFLDLQFITGADVEKGSGFLTSYYVGRMAGSILVGILFHRLNLKVLFAFSTACNGAIAAAIPWCSVYELMVLAHLLYGLFGGIIDAGVTSTAVIIWDVKGSRTFLQVLNLAFSLSTIISPVVTAPFLLNQEPFDFHETTTELDVSNITEHFKFTHIPEVLLDIHPEVKPESRLYIAYTVTAILSLTACLPFFIMICNSSSIVNSGSRGGKKTLKFHGKLSPAKKMISLINIGFFVALQCAIDYTFAGFLTLFCVTHLEWSKLNASILTSVYFLANLCGRLSTVFLIQIYSSLKLLGTSVIATALGFAGFLMSAHFHSDIGVWVSTCAIGLLNSLNYPVFLVWVNDTIISISGPVSAYILVTAFTGALVNPLIISVLMKKFSVMWFCYDSLIGCCLIMFSFALMVWYTNLMNSYRKKEALQPALLGVNTKEK